MYNCQLQSRLPVCGFDFLAQSVVRSVAETVSRPEMALLGAVASLARWFGTSTLELTPVDYGCWANPCHGPSSTVGRLCNATEYSSIPEPGIRNLA